MTGDQCSEDTHREAVEGRLTERAEGSVGRGSVHRRSTALSAAGARGRGQSRCGCRTVSSEGGASGEVAGPGGHRGR